METVIMSTRDTPDLWLIVCDANVVPDVFVQGRDGSVRGMIIKSPSCQSLQLQV